MDELIYFGGAVKALGDGRVGGYLVEFTDPATKAGAPPDLTREFFTKSTDLDVEDGERKTVYFDHGQDPVLKRRKLSKAELKTDEVGVWAETILDTRDKYLAKIYEMAEAGKLGWSSGSAPHLTSKKKHDDGFTEITTWPIVEASLTHRPCNPFSQAIPLKSLGAAMCGACGDNFLKGVEDYRCEEHGGIAVKAVDGAALFNESLRQREMRCWELTDALHTGARKIVDGASAQNVTGVAVNLREAGTALAGAFVPPWVDAFVAQAEEYLQGDKSEPFYLKSVFDELTSEDEGARAALKFADHLEVVLAAAREVNTRAKSIQELRVKAGRVLSEANRTRLSGLLESLRGVVDEIGTLLADAEPKPKSAPDDEVLNLVAQFEDIKFRRLRAATTRS